MSDEDLIGYKDFSYYIKNEHPILWEEIKTLTLFESKPIFNKYTGLNLSLDKPLKYDIYKYKSKLVLLNNLKKL